MRAPENAFPIDSTIDTKNDLTLLINNPGNSVNRNLTPLKMAPNAASGKSTNMLFRICVAKPIIFKGNVIKSNFNPPANILNAAIGKSININFNAPPMNFINVTGRVM